MPKTVCESRTDFDARVVDLLTLRPRWRLVVPAVIGAVAGAAGFMLFEGAESIRPECFDTAMSPFWRHGKVYAIAALLIFIAVLRADWFIAALGGAWFGLHFTKDMAERRACSAANQC